jgi:transcriptional regulator with XRE-family HTH domain
MSITQKDIARIVGLDVSSVNKILNRRQGPKFKKETISQVFKVAKRFKYDFGRDTKGSLAGRVELLEKALKEIVPSILTIEEIAARTNLSVEKAREIRELAYGKQSA